MAEKRLNIGTGLRALLDYPKFVGNTRMLVLETDYFFDASWKRAAKRLGWETASVSSAMTGGLTRDQVVGLFRTIAEFKPDFIITSNYAGMDVHGVFARFFEDVKLPYVSWFTDTPRMILFNRTVHANPYSVAAVWERTYMKHLNELGFAHVYFMPHATDPDQFSGEPQSTFERGVAFVGDSMISHAEEAWGKLEAFPELRKALRDAFDTGRVTREQLALGVETILSPALVQGCEPRERRHVELYLVYEGTRRIRAALAHALVGEGLEVHGDAHWRRVHPLAFGDIGYFDALAPFYRSTAININSTSIQMATAVNQRVFDCPAAGGFLITDAQSDLNEFFDPGTECVTYRTVEELRELVGKFKVDPEQRRRVVRNAQRRIAAEHTHAHRLASLKDYLQERFG